MRFLLIDKVLKQNYMNRFIISLALLSFLTSCVDYDINNEIIIKGYTKDTFRNIVSPNVKVMLYEKHTSGVNTMYHSYGVKVDSTISDVNGYYELNYSARNKRHYIKFFNNTSDNKPYYFEIIGEEYYDANMYGVEVNMGEENEINVNAFVPNILKIETHVENNMNNHLGNRSTYYSNSPYYSYDRSSVIISGENIDTLYYLTARPNSDMKIYFIYHPTPDVPHSNPHSKVFNFHSNTMDTISLSYSIDCSTF